MKKYFLEYRRKIFYFLNYLIMLFALVMPINPYLGKKVFAVIGILWLFSVDYKKSFKVILDSKILVPIILFSLMYIVSILWSNNVEYGLKWVGVHLTYFLLPIIVFSTVLTKEFSYRVIAFFIFSMMINEIISYGIFFGLVDTVLGYKVHGTASNPVPFQVSHIPYSLYIAFTIFLGLYSIKYQKYLPFKIITTIFVVTMTINLFLSSGRTGQFVFVMTSICFLFIYFIRYKKIFFSMIVVLVSVFVLAYSYSSTFQQRVIAGKSDIEKVLFDSNYNSSLGVRLGSYKIAPNLLLDNNILVGIGVGDIGDVVHKRTTLVFGKNSAFEQQKGLLHNTFLEILLTLGIVGFSIFIWFLYSLVFSSTFNHYNKYIRYLLLFSIVFSGLSASFYSFKEIMFLFALFIPIVATIEREKAG